MSLSVKSVSKIIPNSAQQECIKSIDGPVMVLAGPGTGKTTTIIKRIENMLNNGIAPESILALTFSEAAASEMKVRLLNQVGAKASSVVIHTYHAFCSDIISQNALRFELFEDFNVIDDLNKYRYMREAIDQFNPKHLRTQNNDPYFYVPYLIKAVHDIKLNRITKEKYFSVIMNNENWQPQLKALNDDLKTQEVLEKTGKRNRLKTVNKNIETLELQIKKAEEIWGIYEKYSKKLNSASFIDFDDMINFVLNAFEDDPTFLEEIRHNFKYILVDEYQDTNHSQNELIFKLASEADNSNLFVVGDDDQIIYSFQGARIDNLERFLSIYPKAKIICLNENNRSSQQVLDFSYEIISQDTERLENNERFKNLNISKKLLAKNVESIEKGKSPELHIFSDTVQEKNYVIDKIQVLIDSRETELSEIAILSRTNFELEQYADLLKNRGIPFQISKQKDIFTIKPSLILYLYLKALENHELASMGLFGLIAHPPFSFDVSDYTFLLKESNKSYEDFITIITKNLKKYKWENSDRVNDFINIFNKLKALINEERLSNLLIHIINETGILEYYINQQDNKFENISSLKKFIEEVKYFEQITKPATLTMLLSYLESSIKENIGIQIDDNSFIENAVQLLTLHKSKGREFSNVFMVNLSAKNWEKKRSVEVLKLPIDIAVLSKNSEIARLLFVGCSRSKYNLVLTHSNMVNGKNTELSTFIQKASDNNDLIKVSNHTLDSEGYIEEVIRQLVQIPVYNKKTFIDSLEVIAKKHVMSPSSMYTYHNCPKQFLYSYLFRVPRLDTINTSLSFGSAIHYALEKFVKYAMKAKAYPDLSKFIKYFEAGMDKQLFPSMQERENRLTLGKKLLQKYYKNIVEVPLPNIYGVELNLNLVPIDKYFIKGKIDRMEIDSSGDYCVADYKTGWPISRNQVISKDGTHRHYFDQLSFYKLLFETSNPSKKATRGEILFVGEPEKSLYIDLVEEDKIQIKEKIITTFEKIHNLEFTGIDEAKQLADQCKRCDYKMLCSLNSL